MVFDFIDIWIPQIRYKEIVKSAASVTASRAAMNCQRAKRLLHIGMVLSSHGAFGWQRMATRRMEMKAQVTHRQMVLQIAIE
jgi:hypothetical protein